VLGAPTEQLLRTLIAKRKVGLAVLAIPTAEPSRIRDLVAVCRKLGLRAKTVPSLAERMAGETREPVREINIEDLLGRPPVELDMAQVNAFIEGKVVLVTGAGGSIGSELCRQALKFLPRQILMLDHDENAIFQLERELQDTLGVPLAAELVRPIIADVTNAQRMDWVFATYRPQVVLHAAAHKHVAMMEANSCEAANNNIFGTRTVAEAANAAGTENFVLISTDKAVNPSSVMGATKRVCELVIQDIATRSETRFAAVRFGNVLGSNGSVVPIFQQQIARGGPVTVTHPEVMRYFMSIPEAVRLVLQAGALGGSGDIFLLDMGKPVKIVDLARDLIELSGLRPGVDIQIEFSGLKSGEKLYEEMLLNDESSTRARPHPQIVLGSVRRLGASEFTLGMRALSYAIRTNDDAELRRALTAMMPGAKLAAAQKPGGAVHHLRPVQDWPAAEDEGSRQTGTDIARTPRGGIRIVTD
jgi:FlaA1/EpsC-like NDP-sugar epimerase